MLAPLTPRELEILQLINIGLTNAEIAHRLTISRGTVKAHTHNIYSKLGVNNRTQAVIKANEVGVLSAEDSQQSADIINDLPADLTPFIGRHTELEQLSATLHDERVRLITILGAGGMGKSRLAHALVEQVRASFDDGAIFIPLMQVTNQNQCLDAIIAALGLRLQSSTSPEQQLHTYLQDKYLLLVLDTFEHLLDAADLINDILRTAPGVKIVITSRERLNLSAEVVFVLGGLGYDADESADPLTNDAARLLIERARFANPHFTPLPDELSHLRRICQLTEGMPLALVLAAGWMEMLTLQEIAEQLSGSIDILESQLRDLPARQRSMRATIASSWERLPPEQQAIFSRLTIFRSGFSREAAQRVTGATLRQLQTLVNRSFITVHEGRYGIHELLRQFVEEAYPLDIDTQNVLCNQHGTYYADFLGSCFEALMHGDDLDVIPAIIAELDNVHAAWEWALTQGRFEMLETMARVLGYFFHVQNRYLECVQLHEATLQTMQALTNLEDSPRSSHVLAILNEDLGFTYVRLGRLDDAETAFNSACQYQPETDFVPTTDPLIGLSLCMSIRGRYDAAIELAESALRKHEATGSLINQGYAHYVLVGVELAQGFYQQALARAKQSVTLAEQAGDRWLLAHCLLEQGKVLHVIGEISGAETQYRASYDICEAYGDLVGMAEASNHLGRTVLARGDFAEARQRYQRCATIYRQTQDQGGLAAALYGLGRSALGMGDYDASRNYLQRALTLAAEMQYLPLVFAILLQVAELRRDLGRTTQAITLLRYIQQHPANNQATRDRAHDLLGTLSPTASELEDMGDADPSSSADLAIIIAAVQAELD